MKQSRHEKAIRAELERQQGLLEQYEQELQKAREGVTHRYGQMCHCKSTIITLESLLAAGRESEGETEPKGESCAIEDDVRPTVCDALVEARRRSPCSRMHEIPADSAFIRCHEVSPVGRRAPAHKGHRPSTGCWMR